MIDHEKWTNTLNIRKKDIDNESNLDPNKWIETLPKPKTKNSINNNIRYKSRKDFTFN